ncbi:MAG: hypothetical protein CMI18_11135 [Opitutaceae bacterium]|nr:hypothetical protein [Opitutaceae bacterium]
MDIGQYPLTEYLTAMPPMVERFRPAGGLRRRAPGEEPEQTIEYLADDWGPVGFGPDDDSLFQVANLLLLEEKGFDITSQDIANQWLASFSVFEAANCGGAVRAAERRLKEGIKPPESG